MAPASRQHMVELLVDRGITDARVLDAMGAVPRERFVPDHLRRRAYEDRPLPIGHGATISQPWVVARMLELAALTEDDSVLDVGTGSGYAAAVASHLAREVVSVERVRLLAQRAATVLAESGYPHVDVHVTDGSDGWPERAPYDAVLVAAATAQVPAALTAQLAIGGRMVVPLGDPDTAQRLTRLVRRPDGLDREDHRGVRFVPLLPGTIDDRPDDS